MKYNAVIFDLDGTLLHTLEDLLDNLNYAFNQVGLKGDFTLEEMETFLGSGKKAQLERALLSRGYGLEHFDKIDHVLSIRYKDNAENKTKPFDGIIELLTYLKNNKTPAICLTNKPHEVALKVIDTYFPHLITATYGIRPNAAVKPDPSLVNNVLFVHKLNREEVLYVGDSDIDMMTANNGKLDSVFVTWGYVRFKDVEQYHPMYVVDHPLEIITILNR